MKKLISVIITVILAATLLVGCGGNKLELYSGINLSDYVSVCDYKNIEIDTSSDSFADYLNDVLSEDVENNNLYNKLEEGTVENGDIVNLDYTGTIDGVAFSGGTATGDNLEIGSNTFIDDFEEQLIGVAVGDSRDVTVTFPSDYGNEELNGKEAVFACTINYIARPYTAEEAYKELNFNSLDDYMADLQKRAVKVNITDIVCDNSKIINYPDTYVDKTCDAVVELQVAMFKANNSDLEAYLTQSGATLDDYKTYLSSNIIPQMMDVSMVMYSILKTEKLEVLESTIESQNVDNELIAESYAVQDTVLEYLYGIAEIK